MVKSIDLNFGIDRILLPNYSTQKPAMTETKRVTFHAKKITKRKKKDPSSPSKVARITFTDDQLDKLEQIFTIKQYVPYVERKYLAEKLGLKRTSVKFWFQNRRIRFRREEALKRALVERTVVKTNFAPSDLGKYPTGFIPYYPIS